MRFIKKRKILKTKELRERKKLSPKTARIIFTILAVFLLFSGPVGFLFGKKATSMSKNNQDRLQRVEKTLRSENQQAFDTFLAQRFLASFIPVYMNKTTDSEKQSNRNSQLSRYYSSSIPMEEDGNSTQTLKEQTLYHFKRQSKGVLAQYIVRYDLSYPVEKKRTIQKKDNKQVNSGSEAYTEQEVIEKEVLLNIPLTQLGQHFKVIGLPYYTPIPTLIAGRVTDKKSDYSNYKRLSEGEAVKVMTFLKEFYTYYTSGDKKQVTYLMEEPEVAPKGYEITDSEPVVYEDKSDYIVTDTVTLKEKGVKNSRRESFSFRILKNKDHFYIQHFSHELGGISK